MTLLDVIEKSENARKVFGKSELKIIKKQLIGIKLTQSEKNRLSRDIRPKFEFMKTCCPYKDEFSLKKGSGTLKKVNILKDKILLDKLGSRIKKIYLFGSFVENKMSFNSDIDISVEFYEDVIKKEILEFKNRLIIESEEKFDISIFNNLPKKIRSEVKNNGKIIYENIR